MSRAVEPEREPERDTGAVEGEGVAGPRWTRRRLLGAGVGLGALIALPVRFGGYGSEAAFAHLQVLSPREAAILLAVVDAMLPDDAARDPATLHEHVTFIDGYLVGTDETDLRDFGGCLFAIEHLTPLGWCLRRLSRLDRADRRYVLRDWQTSRIGLRRLGLRSLKSLVFLAYYRSERAFATIGYPGPMVRGFTGPEASRARYAALAAPAGARPGAAWTEPRRAGGR